MIVPFFVMLSITGAWPGFAWPSPWMVSPLRPWAASRARSASSAWPSPPVACSARRAWPPRPVPCFRSQSTYSRRRCSWWIAARSWSWRLWIASRSARSAALAWAYSSFLVTRACCARPSTSIAMRTLRPKGDAAEVRRIITGAVPDDSNVGEQSAIDADDRARDVRGIAAREERDHIGVLLRLAVAADRDARVALGGHVGHRAAFALGLLFVEELDAARGHAAGQHDVAGDAV